MTIFDLLYIIAVVASLVTLGVAAVFAVRRQLPGALRVLRFYCICAAAYAAIALAVDFLKPQRVMSVGDPWCFDDWCLTVDRVNRTYGPSQVSYTIDLRIFSRARRVSQRANGAWIYLIDEQGRRYSPDPSPSAVQLDALLQPLATAITTRVFRVPPDSHVVGVITGHGGPYCGPMDLLIIGSGGCLFGKPTMIRIQ